MCLFPKKYFGFACSFAGEEHEVHVLGKKKCSYEEKKVKKKKRLMFIFNFFLNFLIYLFF